MNKFTEQQIRDAIKMWASDVHLDLDGNFVGEEAFTHKEYVAACEETLMDYIKKAK